ncbi:MAG: hypothetical protein IPP17_31165 [Bacteroidetes bacterium]|nr:hypothetical protein [Bacteroidota bacterium]
MAVNFAIAQKPNSAPKKEFSYEMVSSEGTNAAAVVWDSKHGVYITVIAGNADFPRRCLTATVPTSPKPPQTLIGGNVVQSSDRQVRRQRRR